MNSQAKTKLVERLSALIQEGYFVREGRYFVPYQTINDDRNDGLVDPLFFRKWLVGCRNLIHQIGAPAQMWAEEFTLSEPLYLNVGLGIGALEALRTAVEHDLLDRMEDLVTADAFDSLLEQAEQLLNKSYFLAAGVLGRAILEEHLRKLCDRHSSLPPNRPTINDLNQALYKASAIDKVAMKHVEAMAAVGNHCAHNDPPPLTDAIVGKFLADVRDFLALHPLS